MNQHHIVRRGFVAAFAAFFCISFTAHVQAQPVLYGGESGGSSNFGTFGTVNQDNADYTLIGDPTENGPLVGIAFNSAGALFGVNNPDSNGVLIRINPATGQLIDTVGPITDAADDGTLRITDIAFQPGTDVLFGITGPPDGAKEGNLYTINTTTAVATLVGNTGLERGGLAFAPDGTLYLATVGDDENAVIARINPANAAVVGTPQDMEDGIDGLAVRPTDSAIFGTGADSDDLYIIDPTDGDQQFLGSDSSDGGLASLAFGPVQARATAPALSSLGIIMLCGALFAGGWALIRRRTHLA